MKKKNKTFTKNKNKNKDWNVEKHNKGNFCLQIVNKFTLSVLDDKKRNKKLKVFNTGLTQVTDRRSDDGWP